MPESGTPGGILKGGMEDSMIVWGVPECPFTIEASARVLDDIRLAVTDAFFSLPRGGAEIGGVLLGKFDDARLVISDYAALECEHAYGPSFNLSPKDEERLKSIVNVHDGCAGGLRAVGWYHSHTRSEIFLSDVDLAIHKRYFPESWQVALVLKPHTFLPTRFGYFFRGVDGAVSAASSYRVDELEALPLRQIPAGPPSGPNGHAPQALDSRPAPMFAPVVDIPAEIAPHVPEADLGFQGAPAFEIAATPAAAPRELSPREEDVPSAPLTPVEIPAPRFAVESASSARRWMTVGIAIVGGLGIGGAAFKTKDMWLPRTTAAVRPAQTAPAPSNTLSLNTFDRDGQLQVTWDRNSAGIKDAAYGVLEINESGIAPKAIQLDSGNLQTGTFTYARSTDKAEIKLIIHRKSGPELRESTSFLGRLPEHSPPDEAEAAKQREADAIRQRDEMAKQLDSQAAKNRKLEKDMQAMREEMRRQQKRRMANQAAQK